MSTTLTNGLKLPDKGSVDWYADMQNNYAILDGAVGTIAEHTSALAGKAPLVHTHSKADITDLFNSANKWAEGQTIYSYANIQSQVLERAVSPANTAHVSLNLRDKNNHDLGIFRSLTYSSSGNSTITVFGVTQIKDGQVDPTGTVDTYGFTETCKSDGTKYFTFDGYMGSNLVPLSVNQSIGSSSYQWNNLYAKNYYYNGTAWGLDKLNRWSKEQELRLAELENYALPSSEATTNLLSWWGTTNFRGGFGHQYYTNGDEGCRLLLSSKDANNNDHLSAFRYKLNRAGTDSYFYGTGAQNFHLGTSTSKWKTLNGINPGALSIFNLSATQDPIDVPNTWITDGSAWNTLNVSNMGDGWICLTYLQCGANDYILARFGGTNAGTYPSMIFPATRLADSGYFVYALMPVAKAMGNIYLEIKLDSNAVLIKHSFIPAYGTV